jgi:hypothetical protein
VTHTKDQALDALAEPSLAEDRGDVRARSRNLNGCMPHQQIVTNEW